MTESNYNLNQHTSPSFIVFNTTKSSDNIEECCLIIFYTHSNCAMMALNMLQFSILGCVFG